MDATHRPAVCPAEIHEALKRDEAAWLRLPYVGQWDDLEIRNCFCGSSLARANVCDRCQGTGEVEYVEGESDTYREPCKCEAGYERSRQLRAAEEAWY